jgi:hypothetical protein
MSKRAAGPDIFERFHAGLVSAHAALGDALGALLTDEPGERGVASFCAELLNHHHAENGFFFPAFRAGGRLRSSDVAFLDARDREHEDVHRLCVELRELGLAHARRALARGEFEQRARRLAGSIREISAPHFAAEEAALTGPHVAEMIDARAFAAVYEDMGRNWLAKAPGGAPGARQSRSQIRPRRIV